MASTLKPSGSSLQPEECESTRSTPISCPSCEGIFTPEVSEWFGEDEAVSVWSSTTFHS